MTQLLEVNDLVTRFYTEEGTVYAVNGVSFGLEAGETLAIVGESGSGKTVTALSLMGLVPSPPGVVEAGEVLYRGEDLLKLSAKALRRVQGNEIAMIFQDPMTSLNPVLTIGRQLAEGMQLHLGLDQKAALERAEALLEMVGIPNPGDRLNDYPYQFSGGQRQRVMIAMALSCEPALLIADEPTTALDVTIQAQILDLVARLREQLGMAIIWITHDLGVVAGLVDRVLVMYAGYIVEEAPVKALYRETSHPYTLGLLRSLPRLRDGRMARLEPIKGAPPDPLELAVGCPFEPRCRFAVDQCREENPPLMPVAPYQRSACWRWEEVRAEATAAAVEAER